MKEFSEKCLMFRDCLKRLCNLDDFAKNKFSRYLNLQEFGETVIESLLLDLANLLCRVDSTENVALCFPHILLELLSLTEKNEGERFHRHFCVALGKLVRFHPDAVRFSLQYFETHPSPFHSDEFTKEPSSKKRKINKEVQVNDLHIVTSCYNFLMMSCEHFREIWDWSRFMTLYFGHSDELVSWIACHCLAWVTGMNDSERQIVLKQILSTEAIRTCCLKFDNLQASVLYKLALCPTSTETSAIEAICTNSSVVTVVGIQLPTLNYDIQSSNGSLVPVSSTKSNLHSVALGVASSKAICLQGPVGSGKTAIVEHLAGVTGRGLPPHFIKVQLGDETDSKMLLGTYRCTDIPGEFVWQPGVLTQAAVNGHWILLEDIDTAAMDIASVLASLLETRMLSVPGYKDNVKVAPGFQLFMTQRTLPSVTGFHKPISNSSSLLEKHWLQVNVEPLSKSELTEIVQKMFPPLATVAGRMVKVFLLFSSGSHQSALNATEDTEDIGGPSVLSHSDFTVQHSGRLTSTRDLIKWCYRAIEGFDVRLADSALKVLQDGIDIFCCSVADAGSRVKLAISIASCLGIVNTQAEYFCLSHKPIISSTPQNLVAGRALLNKETENIWYFDSISKQSFAFTRPAACLLERVVCCVSQKEPVLLVGETGTGKTSVVQFLAERTHNHLLVINMNQQSDSSDLLGGYKPIDLKFVVAPVREEFETLFTSYFSVEHNTKFLENIAKCFIRRKWPLLLRLMKQSHKAAIERLKNDPAERARLKLWCALGERLQKLESQINAQSALAFAFVEGSLVKSLKEGHWVLLDEINLASAETLQCLSGLLEGSSASLYLLERGDKEPVKRHPNFHLFACMNPATDVGKKDLPAGLRNRFTEFFVDELTETSDLILLVGTYLNDLCLPSQAIEKVVRFYLRVREDALKNLNDGTGRKPHYSLRTLCRALRVAAANPCNSVLRSLYEGLCLSFLTQLDNISHIRVMDMITRAVFAKEKNSILKQPLQPPVGNSNDKYVNFEGYWVLQGSLEPHVPDKYILTQSVRRNLHDLVRVVAIGHHPVLLQGETSVGKTSLITYLARASGNHCVRINNHEHTDIQEYVGSYSADENGCLVFREGVLVEAMRKGHWIILDELNLAPTDVLEALNRVLDDNRELYIPETQETVKADPRFMLFATQNPSGHYGGRKMLSRAFRNRFVELHFAEIPPNEIEVILEKRCQMPPSYCKKLVAVMVDLQLQRRGSAAFSGKQGFMTLRDLFRWGERYTKASYLPSNKFYDWDQHLADEGYLVLAGRVRKREEADVIRQALQKHIKRNVNPKALFTLDEETPPVTKHILEKIVCSKTPGFEHIVWTYNMRRLGVLVGKSCQFQEPVLLVGETGCGKTTVCQLLAFLHRQKLFTVNCHMHTECADFLGGLRPVRDHTELKGPQKLFEWVDGPLIDAMRQGGLFLADEISLADDSVLERLNSLLEPERTLLLAEKGIDGGQDDSSLVIVAQSNFHFIGTMNPGGDYGKKELSPALRNRFSEIWCESCKDRDDLFSIIEHNLRCGLSLNITQDDFSGVGSCMLDFIEWFTGTEIGKRFPVSVRDILSWVNFINVVTENEQCLLDLSQAYVHGACLTFLDSFGSGVTSIESLSNLRTFQKTCLDYLHQQVGLSADALHSGVPTVTEKCFGIPPFFVDIGENKITANDFTFHAPTTGYNALRVLRAMQLPKPILLEGSPGVGKTTLITALAKASGHNVIRINLSEQTDISDLFGADLPVEGGQGGQFAWRDGPLLRALKAGDWILLDELNLASQSVLEGLNACLDHRGEVFIPELGRTFSIKPGRTHLFGAQNPLRQGGARRGLPQSFLNRFTQVYINALSDEDLEFIICTLYPIVPSELVKKMVCFNGRLARETGELHLWGLRGGPWELNLRDLSRWCQAMIQHCASDESDMEIDIEGNTEGNYDINPGQFVDLLYVDRMRTLEDKEKVRETYREEFGPKYPLSCDVPYVLVAEEAVYLGDEILTRSEKADSESYNSSVRSPCSVPPEQSLLLLRKQYPALRSLARCVNMNWMPIIVGPSGCGKTSLVRLLAQLAGRELRILAVNSAMDTTEILGGFEQADPGRRLEALASRAERLHLARVRAAAAAGDGAAAARLLARFHRFRDLGARETRTLAEETRLLRERADELRALLEECCAELPGGLRRDADAALRELQQLRERVGAESGLSAGGTFEWVDSLLVKCLREGSWLLLDGANLCSPAVLDRLNALLEPGGVLTVGERGVGPSGELVTVTPHPAFRLFLAMDPRHGDISRAMRNRGVELSLPEEPLGALDLAALLAERGLRGHRQRRALLRAHAAAADAWPDTEPPGLSQLLHAAFLAGQRAARGQGGPAGLLAACRDVYVKAHTRCLSGGSAGAAGSKQTLLQVVTAALDPLEGTAEGADPEDCLPLGDATPSAARLHEGATAAAVRQQGALLAAVLGALAEAGPPGRGAPPALHFLDDLLDVRREGAAREVTASVIEILPYLLLIFYERASPRDLGLRHAWLQDLVDKRLREASRRQVDLGDCLQFALKVSATLRDALLQALGAGERGPTAAVLRAPASAAGLPWDLRWLPGTESLLRPGAAQDYAHSANRVALLTRFLFLAKVEEAASKGTNGTNQCGVKRATRSSSKQRVITVAEYSKAVAEGKLLDTVTSHPLIIQFQPLLQHLDAFIQAVLSSNQVTLNTEEFTVLESAFAWRFHLAEQGSLQLVGDPGCRFLDLAISRLTVHMQWLLKKMLPPLYALADKDMKLQSSKCAKKLHASLKLINTTMKSSQTQLHRIGKKLRRYLGQPLPYATAEQSNLAQRIERLSNLLLVWPSTDPGHLNLQNTRVTFLLTKDGKEARKCLTYALENVRKIDQLDVVSEKVEYVEQLCRNADMSYKKVHDNNETSASPKHEKQLELTNAQVQLWPLHEFIAVSLVTLFMKHVLQRKSSCKEVEFHEKNSVQFGGDRGQKISKLLCSYLENLPSIPAEMLAVVHELSRSSDNMDIFVCELIRLNLLHHTLSPSRCLTAYWITWASTADTNDKETIEELITDIEMSQGSLPMHCPLLTSLMANYILPKEKENSSVVNNLIAQTPLGTQHPTTLKLNTILDLLWRNMGVLSSSDFNYKLNDAHCAHSTFAKLRETLDFILLEAAQDRDSKIVSEGNVAEKFDRYVNNLPEENVPEASQLSEALHMLEKVGHNLEEFLKGKETESDLDILIATGETWLLVGCVQIILLSKFGLFDPVEKRSLQVLYVTEEIKNTSQLLYARELQTRLTSLCPADQRSDNLHPHITADQEKLVQLSDHKEELLKNIAYRPSFQPSYSQLVKDASHYSNSLGSANIIMGLQSRLKATCQELLECIQHSAPTQARVHRLASTADDLLNEERMWRNSQRIFCYRLQKTYYLHFPDMVAPLLSAAQQLCQGTYLLASTIHKLLVRLKMKLAEDIVKLVQFPLVLSNKGEPLNVVNLCLDRVFCQQLQQLLQQDDNDIMVKKETYRLMKAGLEDIRNVIAIQGNIDVTTWNMLFTILSRIVKLWIHESDERKRKEREKNEMFVQKGITRCESLSDEQLEALGLQELFPTTVDQDFGDLLVENSLESTSTPLPNSETVEQHELVSPNDMTFVCELHWELVTMFTHTEWIAPHPSTGVKLNFVSPLLQRFQTFRQIIGYAAPGLDSSVDWHLAPSLALLASLALRAGSGEKILGVSSMHPDSPTHGESNHNRKPPDFYHDANVDEARQCIPILNAIVEKCKELMQEWPDHPTLCQILVVVNRINSFPITSSVSRFLTGLELLLEKLHNWEENAHSGVSLQSHIQVLTHQIIAWRRLELQCWKDCLNTSAYRMFTSASHWWFHIFSVIESFNKTEETGKLHSEKAFIKSLQEFMEKSMLGDFHARLDILFSFHCHTIHLPETNHQSKLVNILWNLYQYYNQFSEAINLRIRDLRAPIEKKLRDFVKIARWNDINYWSVKKTVEKTRRTLLKYVREFEAVLKQSVSSVLTNPLPGTLLSERSGKLDRPQRRQSIRHSELPPDFYMASPLVANLITVDETIQKTDSLLNRAKSLFSKSRFLSKEILAVVPYTSLIKSVDEMTISMIHTINHLKELEIPVNTTKQRRKSVAKSHLQQKRKALTDSFRTLQQIGVSFRKGVAAWNDAEASDILFDFTLPPLDLNAGVQHSTFHMVGDIKRTNKGSRPDGELVIVWDGSEAYFYRSMARLSLLDSYLKNPHKDIGLPLIERLRGFSSHLMMYTKLQKEKLIESFNLLRYLRCYISQIASLKVTEALPRQTELHHCWRNFNNLLVNITICMEQFLIFLDACPTEGGSSFLLETSNEFLVSNMNNATHGDPCWQIVCKKVKNIISATSKLKNAFNKSWIELPKTAVGVSKERKNEAKVAQGAKNLITSSQYDLIVEGYEKVSSFIEELKSIRSQFETMKDSQMTFNPMTESLIALETVIQRDMDIFKEIQAPTSSLKGVKRSGIEIENKELEICVNVPDEIKNDDDIVIEVQDVEVPSQQRNIHISLSNKLFTEDVKKEVVNEFLSESENLLKMSLIAIQNIYKKYVTIKKTETANEVEPKEKKHAEDNVQDVKSNEEGSEDDSVGMIQDNHLKEKIMDNLYSDLHVLQISHVNDMLNKLVQRLIEILDFEGWEHEAAKCKLILKTCIPCIDQLSLLYQYFVTQQAAAYRVTTKMLSVVLSASIDLAQKGFCIPQDLMPEEGEEPGESKGGVGLGEGEGEKDVSEKIESEDQLEDARQPGEDEKDDDKDCKEEEQGINTSQDFGGKVHDLEKEEDEDESGGSDEDEEEPDKEMGETGEGADTLDQEVWGSDSEDEVENDEEEEKGQEDQHGQGEETGKPELSAKNDKKEENEQKDEVGDEGEDKDEKRKDINEFEEPVVDEDHVDPYHGKQPPPPEPEPLDLPDDLQLDDEDPKDGAEDEQNPFDIDAMKEPKIPENKEEEENPEQEEDNAKEDSKADSSDSEEEAGDKHGNDDDDTVQEEMDKMDGEDGNKEEKAEDNDQEKDGEDEQKQMDKVSPSEDQPSEVPAQSADMDVESCEASKDMVAEKTSEQKDDGKQDVDDLGEEGGDEQQGVGQAQAEEEKSGHRGHLSVPKDKMSSNLPPPEVDERKDKRQRPGESDSNRSLGDMSEPTKKRLKTIDVKKSNEEEDDDDGAGGEDNDNDEQESEQGKHGEMYQHIKDSKESFDTQTLDAATQEQAEKQPVINKEDEPSEEPSLEDDIDLQEDDIMIDDNIKKDHPEQLPSAKKEKSNKNVKQSDENMEDEADVTVDIEGEVVLTQAPSRGTETTFHTHYNLIEFGETTNKEIDMQNIRQELENQLSNWKQSPADAEAAQAWQGFLTVTAELSRELSEQLRLVLEPTQAARLRGDYRTGRRINMRKVIPYIASQFRKDKIWLRRTKPSKREYQIVLAIDDSSSMADNHTKELAFESLALVSRALSLLEAGELAVVSFGDSPQILHQLGETFTEQNGGRLLQEFSFSQKHTKIGQLVDFCTMLLRDSRQRVSSTSECAQLLMIVSDGRGVFSEGDEKVRQAIRHARQSRIFMVFVILDNPESKDSILDIRCPIFQSGKFLGIKSYLDGFPFPFYLILRDISCLPAVLSDALRQWFELVTNTDAQ